MHTPTPLTHTGTYGDASRSAPECVSCPPGTTTTAEGAVSEGDCAGELGVRWCEGSACCHVSSLAWSSITHSATLQKTHHARSHAAARRPQTHAQPACLALAAPGAPRSAAAAAAQRRSARPGALWGPLARPAARQRSATALPALAASSTHLRLPLSPGPAPPAATSACPSCRKPWTQRGGCRLRARRQRPPTALRTAPARQRRQHRRWRPCLTSPALARVPRCVAPGACG
jgi:hypothetical protein